MFNLWFDTGEVVIILLLVMFMAAKYRYIIVEINEHHRATIQARLKASQDMITKGITLQAIKLERRHNLQFTVGFAFIYMSIKIAGALLIVVFQ